MHRINKYLSPLLASTAILACGCHRETNELAHDHAHHHENETVTPGHDKEEGAHEHEGEIILEPDHAKELGVEVTEIKPGDFSGIIEVSGQLATSPGSDATVAARSAGLLHYAAGITPGTEVQAGRAIATVSARGMAGGDINEANQIALTAAKRELDRLTPLVEDGIVTRRDYNEAKLRYDQARAAVSNRTSSGGSAATSPISGTITALLATEGQYVDAGQPIATISGTSALTLRADLPERYAGELSAISGATFRPAYGNETYDISRFHGTMTGRPSGATATAGYIPVYFTLRNDGTLIPGSYATVYLQSSSRDKVFSVPVEAVTEQQGVKFVYILEHADAYRKQPVTIGDTDGNRIEIISGIKEGDKVVTRGTTFVRLAETSGAVPEGHKHNH